MSRRNSMLYAVLIFGLIALDQITKYVVDQKFYLGETIPVINNFFHITYVQNQGIAFGLFQSKSRLLAILTIVAVILIVVFMYKEIKKARVLEKIAYSFIFAGAVGNMIDRVFRAYVVDMFDFRGVWQYVFNLADAWINIGVGLIVIGFLISRRKNK
ncbi:MAG: signal peptidase II [Fusobacteriaceae bacterium]